MGKYHMTDPVSAICVIICSTQSWTISRLHKFQDCVEHVYYTTQGIAMYNHLDNRVHGLCVDQVILDRVLGNVLWLPEYSLAEDEPRVPPSESGGVAGPLGDGGVLGHRHGGALVSLPLRENVPNVLVTLDEVLVIRIHLGGRKGGRDGGREGGMRGREGGMRGREGGRGGGREGGRGGVKSAGGEECWGRDGGWSGLTSYRAHPSTLCRSIFSARALMTSEAVEEGSTPIAFALPSRK